MSGSDRAAERDPRGNNVDRARRKLWLIDTFGDGTNVDCHWCGKQLTYRTMEVDRYPICGHDGGTYRRDNVVAACGKCNGDRCPGCKGARTGDRPWWWSERGRRGISLRTGRKVAAQIRRYDRLDKLPGRD